MADSEITISRDELSTLIRRWAAEKYGLVTGDRAMIRATVSTGRGPQLDPETVSGFLESVSISGELSGK